jgi:uncharacterized protein YcbX
MLPVQITELHVYPVKGMKGIALQEAQLTSGGLPHDRRWMVVREGGRFVTQRDMPSLALIQTQVGSDGVRLSREGHGWLLLPFDRPGGERIRTRVWQDECEAEDEGEDASRWLTGAVGSEDRLRLVRMAEGFRRAEAAGARFGEGTTVQFADAAPLLVTFEDSLQALNRELQENGKREVPMNRFRPNVVVSGVPAFGEHGYRRIEGEGWAIELVDTCERCLVPTVDQATAERDPDREPFMTLRRINPVPGDKPAPGFGINARVVAGVGSTLAAGSSATLR